MRKGRRGNHYGAKGGRKETEKKELARVTGDKWPPVCGVLAATGSKSSRSGTLG